MTTTLAQYANRTDTLETRRLGTRDGFTITAHLTIDTDRTPTDTEEIDNYRPADIDAWNNDDWHYTIIWFTASRQGLVLGTAPMTAGEHGDSPNGFGTINAWNDFTLTPTPTDAYAAEVILEAIADAHDTLTHLNTPEHAA